MPITGLPSILVSSSEFVLEKKPGAKDPLSHFVKGQVVSARVLEVVSGRQAILLIDGKKMLAKTFVPLKQGQEIQLRATNTGFQPVLRLVEAVNGEMSGGYIALIKSWGKSGPFRHLAELLARDRHNIMLATGEKPLLATLNSLRQLVLDIALKSGEAAPGFLNNLIQGSGLLWEKKLFSLMSTPGGVPSGANLVEKDIKALAMRLLSLECDGQGVQLEGLRTFIDGLENLQLFNQFADEETGRYLFPLPILMQGDLKFGQMFLTLENCLNKSREEDGTVVKVSFLLTLTWLGDLRADFSVFGRAVSGAFGVATEEIKAFIEPRLIELTERLKSHGYEIWDLGCRVVGTEALAETALFDMAIEGTRKGVLNIVI
jgi:hypothetical protein